MVPFRPRLLLIKRIRKRSRLPTLRHVLTAISRL